MDAHDYSSNNSRNVGSNLLFRIDNTKNRIASYGISFYNKKTYSTFDELRSGFLTDYLHENLKRNYNEIMLETNDIIETLNRNKKNTILFYAKKEAFNHIPEEILQQIKNIEYVDGCHECFNDLYTSRSFYHSFLPYI